MGVKISRMAFLFLFIIIAKPGFAESLRYFRGVNSTKYGNDPYLDGNFSDLEQLALTQGAEIKALAACSADGATHCAIVHTSAPYQVQSQSNNGYLYSFTFFVTAEAIGEKSF